MPALRDILTDDALIMDGAMGTELLRRGTEACCEAWNLIAPDHVESIHHAYVNAGAECLVANTFQSNPIALAKHGLQDRMDEINRSALQSARRAANGDRPVLASIGPMPMDNDDVLISVLRTLQSVDGWLLETWSGDIASALRVATDHTVNSQNLPVLASVAYRKQDGRLTTVDGKTPKQIAEVVSRFDVFALGVNCGRDIRLEDAADILAEYRSVCSLPLLVRPNAGAPTYVNGEWRYPITPSDFAAWAQRWKIAGARLIGGCCGTTPAHIAALQ